MRVLIAGADREGALERYFATGLRALGHEVTLCDTHAAIAARLKLARLPVLSRLEREGRERAYNAQLLAQASALRPDLLLVVKGVEVRPATLEAIRRATGALLVNYNPDSPLNPINTTPNLLAGIPLYDLHLTWGQFLLPHLKRLGARRAEYLPFGYDPATQRPIQLSPEQQAALGTDVCFLGSWDPQREAMLTVLAGRCDLGIWGPNWQRLPPGSPLRPHLHGGEVWGLPATRVVAASKIALNFIREQNGDAHNMRTYEIPAYGRFMLTTRTREQEALLGEGVGMACFQSAEELREKVDHYLSHPDEREAIAARGHEIIRSGNHTYTDRMRQLVSQVEPT